MSDYSYIVKQFVNDFRSYVKKVNISIRIAVTPELVGLEHIIRGKKSHKLFEQFLSAYLRRYHPSDIERIDDFIR
jgi:hypothetical protein